MPLTRPQSLQLVSEPDRQTPPRHRLFSSPRLCSDLTACGEMTMPQQQQQSSLDLGLSLGLSSQGSLSSSTTTAGSSGQLSPWAAALSSVVGDVMRRDQQQAPPPPSAAPADPNQGTMMTMMRASTSPDSAAALSSGDSGTKRELERTGSGSVRAGGAGSDEEDGADGAGGRKKLRLSKDQAAVLEECFKTHSTLNPKQKVALANRLGLRPRQVEVWFQNRRARTKLKQTEVDCEYLKRWCERLADENKRLQKELADLRALKTAAPSPSSSSSTAAQSSSAAATLTMCPSCRRVATAGAGGASANQQLQQCHRKSNNNVLPNHCQFFPGGAVDRTGHQQSTWSAAAAPLVTRELF